MKPRFLVKKKAVLLTFFSKDIAVAPSVNSLTGVNQRSRKVTAILCHSFVLHQRTGRACSKGYSLLTPPQGATPKVACRWAMCLLPLQVGCSKL